MLKVMKIRLYPNKEQKIQIHKTIGSARLVYNKLLAEKQTAYKYGNNISTYDLVKQLPILKKDEEFNFLKEVDSTALQQSVLNIGVAYKKFFDGLKKSGFVGFPKFKSKHKSRLSYHTTTSKIKNGKLHLAKIGLVRGKFHRGLPDGKIKTVTVSIDAGQYYASISYEDILAQPMLNNNNGKTIGIDVGINVYAYLSNGEKIEIDKEHDLNKDKIKLIKTQQSLSSKKKGSNNRKKAKIKLQKINLKIRNKKMDFLHKITNKLSENQTIAIEKLSIKSMTKMDKKLGKKKKNLTKKILEMSWFKFAVLLEYKLKRNGGNLIKVNPAYTSQKCSKCGHINKNNRLTQSQFKCLSCGYEANADFNASVNIYNIAVGTTVNAY